jgi:hypothetical protein
MQILGNATHGHIGKGSPFVAKTILLLLTFNAWRQTKEMFNG